MGHALHAASPRILLSDLSTNALLRLNITEIATRLYNIQAHLHGEPGDKGYFDLTEAEQRDYKVKAIQVVNGLFCDGR